MDSRNRLRSHQLSHVSHTNPFLLFYSAIPILSLIYLLLHLTALGNKTHRKLMSTHREDAATAEVSRSQLWQWVKHGVTTAEGKKVDKAYALKLLQECAQGLAANAPKGNKHHLAAQYFAGQVTGEDYADFLTT